MRSRFTLRRLVLVFTVAALAIPVVASSVGAAVDARVRVQSSDASGEVLATLAVTAENVSVRRDGKEKFKPAKDGQSLKEGDTIQTDATGTAEVDYGNDAFTRLDVNTTFTIVVLTDEQGARQVQGSLETGQTWNRTAALTESGSFEQEGAGANATVRGTAFAIECDAIDHCVFTAVVDNIDLTGLDGVTQLLTPLDQCDSTDTTEEGELTGVLCGDITQISADDLPDWIVTNLLQDLILGLPDGGLLTGTVVVNDDGTVLFVPGPTSPTPSGPVTPAAPVIANPPIEVDCCFAIDSLGFSPATEIELDEGEYADFKVRVVPGFDGQLYVVFVTLPSDVGIVYSYCAAVCAAGLDQVYVRDSGDHSNARYPVDTVFRFEADTAETLGCEDVLCDSDVLFDEMGFFVENEGGELTSGTASVQVNVTTVDLCAEDVEAAC